MKCAVIAFLALAGLVLAQGGGRPFNRKSPIDGTDVYQRMVRSDFVILGTVTKLLAVPEYRSAEEIARLHAAGQMVDDFPGDLLRISVDEPLCRNTDLHTASPGEPFPKEIRVFILAVDFMMLDGPAVEELRPGQKYLLFLAKDPKQAENIARFGLDPTVTYYRAVELDRGTVHLPASADEKDAEATHRFVDGVKSVCRAVSTANMLEKQQNLGVLRFSPDASVRGAAEAALKGLGMDIR